MPIRGREEETKTTDEHIHGENGLFMIRLSSSKIVLNSYMRFTFHALRETSILLT